MKSNAPSASPRGLGKRSYTVRAVARAAAILKAFLSPNEELTLRMVAERTRLDKGTVFRLLGTLADAGLVDRASGVERAGESW